MYEYIIGKISYSNSNYVILENNFIGYKIYLNGIELLDKNLFHRIYLYTKVSQTSKGNFSFEYYGFKSIAEKYFFELLLSLNGIGPKTAMSILRNDLTLLKSLIKSNDIESLENLPGFNEKLAITISNQLGYKLRNEVILKKENLNKDDSNSINNISNLISALKSMGYKKNDVESAISKMQLELNDLKNYELNDLISEAIKIIITNENSSNKTS